MCTKVLDISNQIRLELSTPDARLRLLQRATTHSASTLNGRPRSRTGSLSVLEAKLMHLQEWLNSRPSSGLEHGGGIDDGRTKQGAAQFGIYST